MEQIQILTKENEQMKHDNDDKLRLKCQTEQLLESTRIELKRKSDLFDESKRTEIKLKSDMTKLKSQILDLEQLQIEHERLIGMNI